MGLEDGTGTEGPCSEMRIWSLESSEFQKNLNQKKRIWDGDGKGMLPPEQFGVS